MAVVHPPIRVKKAPSSSLDIESAAAEAAKNDALLQTNGLRKELPPIKLWKCQLALALTQTAFCCGSVYLKNSLRQVSAASGGSFHPIIYAFIREAVAGPIMCLIAWASSRTAPKRADMTVVAALGVCLFLNQLFYIIGIDLSGVVVATCMQPTIPVFTAMIAVMLQLEAGSLQKFAGIGLAVMGSVSMVLGGMNSSAGQSAAQGRDMVMGNLCLLANTLSMSIYFLTAKQLVTKYPPMCVAAWAYIVAAACMGATAFATVESSGWQMPAVLFGPLIYWIIICSIVGYYVVTWATQYLPASQVAAFQCLQPFIGTVLAFFVLGEEPSVWDLGAIGVVAGLVLVAREKRDALPLGPALSAQWRRMLTSNSLTSGLVRAAQKP